MFDTTKEIFIVSVLSTLFLFFAHALPINEKIIERNITKSKTTFHKIIAYIIAFLYYVVVLFICFSVTKYIIKKIQ